MAQAVKALRDGDLVVVPTDTVYTLLGDAFQPAATQRMFAAKMRGRDLPLSLLIRNPRQVIGLVREVPDTAERLMSAYWPGPLSIVFAAQPDMPWDLGQTAGTVGLRMPSDDLVLSIAAEIGPLACTTANRRGDPVPATAAEAQSQLGEVVALYVDGGRRSTTTSTVVDCSGGAAHVLRVGAVPAEHVRQVAGGELPWGERPPAPPDPELTGPPPIDEDMT